MPNTLRIIAARLDYLPVDAAPAASVLQRAESGYASRYALSRGYHKVLRHRLR